MKYIFVGGSLISGKNILWRLLDGQPNIAAPAIHAFIGYALTSNNAIDFFARKSLGFVERRKNS